MSSETLNHDDPAQDQPSVARTEFSENEPVEAGLPAYIEGPRHYGRATWNHYAQNVLRRLQGHAAREIVYREPPTGNAAPSEFTEHGEPSPGLPHLVDLYDLQPLWSEAGDPAQLMPDFNDAALRDRAGWFPEPARFTQSDPEVLELDSDGQTTAAGGDETRVDEGEVAPVLRVERPPEEGGPSP